MNNKSFLGQIQRNSVAIISLLVALTGLAYNTWRNEQTERNRNERFAAFEILLKLNELQQLVFHRRYDPELLVQSNPRAGWTYVLTIRDLSRVLPSPVPDDADELLAIWNHNWENLNSEQSSADKVLSGIEQFRDDTLLLLKTLD